MNTALARFDRHLTTEISGLRVDVARDLSGVRFWIGQVAAMAGLLAFMLRP